MNVLTKHVHLTRGAAALVDERDYHLVAGHCWQLWAKEGQRYARRNERWPDGRTRQIWMHRIIIDAPSDRDVDHVDGNGLHNCRANLRIVRPCENGWNRKDETQETGVSLERRSGKWRASLRLEGNFYQVGTFDSKDEAIAARSFAAKVMRGSFYRFEAPPSVDLLVYPLKLRQLIRARL